MNRHVYRHFKLALKCCDENNIVKEGIALVKPVANPSRMNWMS